MTLSAKVKNSASETLFTLYKEGLFYKCYNQDAMVFAKLVKPYKVSKRYVKSVGVEVLSLGFPASEVSRGNLTLEMLCHALGATNYEVVGENVTFHLKEDVKKGYESWHEGIVMESNAQYCSKPNNSNVTIPELINTELVAMIKSFDLANSTPMQGLNFIQQLKKEVQKTEGCNGNI